VTTYIVCVSEIINTTFPIEADSVRSAKRAGLKTHLKKVYPPDVHVSVHEREVGVYDQHGEALGADAQAVSEARQAVEVVIAAARAHAESIADDDEKSPEEKAEEDAIWEAIEALERHGG
jgi:hypothetical protein